MKPEDLPLSDATDADYTALDKIRLGRANNYQSVALPGFLSKLQVRRESAQEKRSWELASNNVFQCMDDLSGLDLFKLIIGLLLAIPRLLIAIIVFLLFEFVLVVVTLPFDSTKPLPLSLRAVHDWISYFAVNTLAFVMGLVIKTKGTPCRTEEALVQVICPHSTFFDPMVVSVASKGVVVSFIAKAELTKLKFLFNWMQVVFVNRKSKASRGSAADALVERSTNSVWGRKVSLFPEGTCGNRTGLMRFSTGAFRTGAPVQPVIIRWDKELAWTSGSLRRNLIFFRSLGALYHDVEVEFLPVYTPSQEEIDHPSFYANNVRERCADELDLPLTNASFPDRLLAKSVAKKKVPPGKILNFYFEDVITAIKDKTVDIPKGQFLYSDAELIKYVKLELKGLVLLFLRHCDKGSYLLSKKQVQGFSALSEKDLRILKKGLPEEEAAKSIQTLNRLSDTEFMKKDGSFSFKDLAFAFFDRKYVAIR